MLNYIKNESVLTAEGRKLFKQEKDKLIAEGFAGRTPAISSSYELFDTKENIARLRLDVRAEADEIEITSIKLLTDDYDFTICDAVSLNGLSLVNEIGKYLKDRFSINLSDYVIPEQWIEFEVSCIEYWNNKYYPAEEERMNALMSEYGEKGFEFACYPDPFKVTIIKE